jgi:hypothetical protein
MSNHFSAAKLKHPGDDARLDLTDLFVFAAPGNPGQTVLIMNSNPFTKGDGFHPDAVYRFNIDTDGDALADVAFSFTFSPYDNGRQTATAYYATGNDAQTREPRGDTLIQDTEVGFDGTALPVQAGPCRLFTGTRSDPFFADADGVLHWLIDGQHGNFQWTGTDTFAGANILSIALEVPNEMLSTDSAIGVWASVSVRRDDEIVQVDRGGHPTINPFVNPNNVKNEYNLRQPVDDLANYLELWSELLENNGYSAAEARTAALIVLPDILRYDRGRPTAYPNGRALTDDVFSERFAWMTNGKVGPDGLKPHGDMLAEFPYLGVPNRYPGV